MPVPKLAQSDPKGQKVSKVIMVKKEPLGNKALEGKVLIEFFKNKTLKILEPKSNKKQKNGKKTV